MRFLLLFLAGCPGTTSKPTPDTGADDTAAPTETAEDTPTDTTFADTAKPEYTPAITWEATFAAPTSADFWDLISAGNGAFYLSSPRANGNTGAIWRIDAETTSLDDAPTWTGTASREALGVGVSTFDLPGVGPVIASAEYALSAGYPGRFLAAPDDGIGGVMSELAVIDIEGPVAGSGNTGGFFGYGSAVWGESIYISQTNAEPAVHAGPAVEGLTFADMAPVIGVDGDPYPDGGQGYVGRAVRSTGAGLLVCSDGAVCQHIGDDGPDWFLAGGEVQLGEADLSTIARDVSTSTYADTIYDYYVVTSLGVAAADRYVLVLDDEGTVVLSADPGVYISVTAGELSSGAAWTAWGAFAHLDEIPDQDGLVYLIVDPPDGEAVDVTLPLPLEGEYSCAPQLESDGVDQIAVMCIEGDAAMIGTVE